MPRYRGKRGITGADLDDDMEKLLSLLMICKELYEPIALIEGWRSVADDSGGASAGVSC